MSFAYSSSCHKVTTFFQKTSIAGENAYKNTNFRPVSQYFPHFLHLVLVPPILLKTEYDDGVVIAHAEPQSRCVVYASNGQPVVSTVIEGDSQKIRLQKGQVYILTINGRTLKFAL